MGILTEEMKEAVNQRRLGYVATVCPDGTPNLLAVLQSVLQTPSQIPDLLRTACDERTARRTLKAGRARLGAALAFPGYDVSAAPLLMGRDLPVSESLATS